MGCIIPRPRGSVLVACIHFLMSLAYLVGGAPRAASSPSRSGLTQWHVSFMHLLKPATLMFDLSMITTCSIVASHGASARWHIAGAWVRPYHVDKPKRSSSGSRHAPRMSPHQALSAFTPSRSNQQRAGNHKARSCSSLCWLAGTARITLGGTASSPLFRAIRLHVKRGAPEHRD